MTSPSPKTCLHPCWDCIKGRHLICEGIDDEDGMLCDCTHQGELEWTPPYGPYFLVPEEDDERYD